MRQSGSSVMLNDMIHTNGSHDGHATIGSVTSDGFEVTMLAIFGVFEAFSGSLYTRNCPCPHLLPCPSLSLMRPPHDDHYRELVFVAACAQLRRDHHLPARVTHSSLQIGPSITTTSAAVQAHSKRRSGALEPFGFQAALYGACQSLFPDERRLVSLLIQSQMGHE